MTYSPQAGYLGSDVFIHTVVDGFAGVDTAAVTVLVVEPDRQVGVVPMPVQAASTHTFTCSPGTRVLTTTLRVPAGVYSRTFTLAYEEVVSATEAAPAGYLFAGRAFRLDAYVDGEYVSPLSFDQPITVTLAYDPDSMPDGDEDRLELWYWDEGEGSWSQDGISLVSRDVVGNVQVYTLTHLTEYSLFAGEVGGDVYLPAVIKHAWVE